MSNKTLEKYTPPIDENDSIYIHPDVRKRMEQWEKEKKIRLENARRRKKQEKKVKQAVIDEKNRIQTTLYELNKKKKEIQLYKNNQDILDQNTLYYHDEKINNDRRINQFKTIYENSPFPVKHISTATDINNNNPYISCINENYLNDYMPEMPPNPFANKSKNSLNNESIHSTPSSTGILMHSESESKKINKGINRIPQNYSIQQTMKDLPKKNELLNETNTVKTPLETMSPEIEYEEDDASIHIQILNKNVKEKDNRMNPVSNNNNCNTKFGTEGKVNNVPSKYIPIPNNDKTLYNTNSFMNEKNEENYALKTNINENSKKVINNEIKTHPVISTIHNNQSQHKNDLKKELVNDFNIHLKNNLNSNEFIPKKLEKYQPPDEKLTIQIEIPVDVIKTYQTKSNIEKKVEYKEENMYQIKPPKIHLQHNNMINTNTNINNNNNQINNLKQNVIMDIPKPHICTSPKKDNINQSKKNMKTVSSSIMEEQRIAESIERLNTLLTKKKEVKDVPFSKINNDFIQEINSTNKEKVVTEAYGGGTHHPKTKDISSISRITADIRIKKQKNVASFRVRQNNGVTKR